MSHDHKKKHHQHHDAHTKKHHKHHEDKGKLSDAMKNKGSDDDYNELTPGFQAVTEDSPKDLEGDLVAVIPAYDEYDKQLNRMIINIGADDGVMIEMDAYLIGADGTRYKLGIGEVNSGTTYVYGDQTESFIQSQTALRVIFNPSK